jgi:hypothetical protein
MHNRGIKTKTSFSFKLPEELSARKPPELRGISRDRVKLLVIERESGNTITLLLIIYQIMDNSIAKTAYSLNAPFPEIYLEVLKPFELSESKAAIKIPLDKPVPVQLLTRIVKSGAKANLENSKLKVKGKK